MILTILVACLISAAMQVRQCSATPPAPKLRAGTIAGFVLLVAVLFLPARAQDQQPNHRPGWPCAGTVDPVYVRNAEATGGAVLLFHPTEVAGAGAESSASLRHEETVFRAGGQLAEGAYEFDVPVDSTIESAYFFVSLQCLQIVTIVRPSGDELLVNAAGVDYHHFEAVRLFTVREPTPGIWKVRVSGRGVFFLIVKAKTDLRLTGMSFVEGSGPLQGQPKFGKPQRLEATMSGVASQVGFQFISLGATTIEAVDLDLEEESDSYRTYAGAVTPRSAEFRLAMTGIDAKGFRFQRVCKRLFTAER